jgi:decaprenyl-phosphate phosphoribosyltransferase
MWPYLQIARIDHWFKNAFMLLGILLALFYEPTLLTWANFPQLGLAVLATCLIASSNYVLNELLDAPQDRFHPTKKHRPVPSGKVRPALALLEWLLLGTVGLSAASFLNPYFAISGLALWLMGIVYNVRPIRTKEIPYIDVLSESINNPIRLLLGWFALIPDGIPPLSLTLAYWMVGAFFMATKRFAEYRHIGDQKIASQYRKSFGYYTDDRLLISMLYYVTMYALFAGVFIIRYHVELIVFIPMAAGFLAYYLKLGLQHDSPVQNPEKLYKERGFVLYAILCSILFVLLMFTHIPVLYSVFNIERSKIVPLWTLHIGSPEIDQINITKDAHSFIK